MNVKDLGIGQDPLSEYLVDSAQRSLLYWDVMRRRGNEYLEHLAKEAPHVLQFQGELVMDGRDLVESSEPNAKLALDYFVFRIARELGALAAAMGGLDGLVFTAGIGERSARIRAEVCQLSAWLGVEIDPAANEADEPLISTPASKIVVRVVPTDEERMIAIHTRDLLTTP